MSLKQHLIRALYLPAGLLVGAALAFVISVTFYGVDPSAWSSSPNWVVR